MIAARTRAETTAILDKNRVNPRTLTSVLGVLGRARKMEVCTWVYEWAKTERMLNVVHYNRYIDVLGKDKRTERALEVFAQMRGEGVRPDTITYSALISACEKGGQWERALEVFAQMRGEGVRPNTITYNALISACEKGGQWERALELFQEMQEAKLPLHVATFNPLLTVLWESGQRLEALRMFQQALHMQLYPDPCTKAHEVDLHSLSSGAASVALAIWLSAVRDSIFTNSADRDNGATQLEVITGWGKHSSVKGSSQVKDAAVGLLRHLNSPFKASAKNPGRLTATTAQVKEWMTATETSGSSFGSSILDLLCKNTHPMM